MKVTFYIGCFMCGIKKKYHKKKTCGEEAKLRNFDLIANFTAQKHMWGTMKEVKDWDGISQTLTSLEKEIKNVRSRPNN